MGLFSQINIIMIPVKTISHGGTLRPDNHHKMNSLIQQQRNLPSIKTGLENIHCFVPSQTIQISTNGVIYVCGCPIFVPFPVANILDLESFEEVRELSTTKNIIGAITDRTYKYCDTYTCGLETHATRKDWPTHEKYPEHTAEDGTRLFRGQGDGLDTDEIWIAVGIDDSCNLQCPSCRLHKKDWNKIVDDQSKDIFNQLNALHNHIKLLINNYDKKAFIEFGATGDPFYSLATVNLISNLEYNPLHRYNFLTNGMSIKAVLPKLKILPSVELIDISIDAATKETHEKIRLGSNWNKVIDNVKWLLELPNRPKVMLNFTVQNDNFREIIKFNELAIDELGVDNVTYTLYNQWTHITDDIYAKNAVHLPTHPNHDEYKKILTIASQRNKDEAGRLSELRGLIRRIA